MAVDYEWHDDYLIGIEEIDAQHKRFLKLIKATYELKNASIEDKEVFILLDELAKYALFHFDSEESFMELYSYPKLFIQIEEHNKIKKELQDKVRKIKDHEGDLVELLFFLMKWFAAHTSYIDKEFGNYMRTYREALYMESSPAL